MTSFVENKQVILNRFPKGWVQDSDMTVRITELSTQLEEGTNDVLLKNLYLSLDPYMRLLMKEESNSSFRLGSVLIGGGVSKVVKSNHPDYAEGDLVQAAIGWEEYTLIKEGKGLRKLPLGIAPPSYYLGVLGMPGMTAYFGLLNICTPKSGEAVFVSAASGAVGQIVGQLAKLSGCYVVGSAGSSKKVSLLKDHFGFDNAFNYKEELDFNIALKKYFPKGIDIYFENVGGKLLDAVLVNMNKHGRIAVCGMVSQYNLDAPEPVHNLIEVIFRQIKLQGFVVGQFESETATFLNKMGAYVADKKVKYLEDVTQGLEATPGAFVGMLKGQNVGKSVVKI